MYFPKLKTGEHNFSVIFSTCCVIVILLEMRNRYEKQRFQKQYKCTLARTLKKNRNDSSVYSVSKKYDISRKTLRGRIKTNYQSVPHCQKWVIK